MCRKNPNDCRAKIKCKCCKEKLEIEQKDDTLNLNLNEVDSMFEQQHYIIETRGE